MFGILGRIFVTAVVGLVVIAFVTDKYSPYEEKHSYQSKKSTGNWTPPTPHNEKKQRDSNDEEPNDNEESIDKQERDNEESNEKQANEESSNKKASEESNDEMANENHEQAMEASDNPTTNDFIDASNNIPNAASVDHYSSADNSPVDNPSAPSIALTSTVERQSLEIERDALLRRLREIHDQLNEQDETEIESTTGTSFEKITKDDAMSVQ